MIIHQSVFCFVLKKKEILLVRYATAGLDPNIFVQKYKIQLPSEEEIKRFLSKEIG